MSEERSSESGCFTVGSVVAAIISASLNHSFWWGVLHFFLSWAYVLYAAIVHSREIIPALRNMFGV